MVASAGEDRRQRHRVRLDALQRLGFQLVEGEVDLALPVGSPADAGADVAVEADIAHAARAGGAGIRHEPLSRAPGTLPTPAAASMPSGLKMRCAAPSIISA